MVVKTQGKKIADPLFEKKLASKLEKQRQLIEYQIKKFEDEKFPKYVDNYKKYLGIVLDRAMKIEPWQVNISYPLISSIVDTIFANLFDFDYVFGVGEQKLQELCVNAFDYNAQGKTAIKGAMKECIICGPGYINTGLLKKTETHNFFRNKVEKSFTTKIPSMNYVSVFNVFYDDVMGINESPYKILRVFKTGEQIIKDYSIYLKKYNTTALHEVAYFKRYFKVSDTDKKRFSLYDYNPVKNLNNYIGSINDIILKTRQKSAVSIVNEIDFENFFKVDTKKLYEIVEYKDNESITVYLDGMIMLHEENDFSFDVSNIYGISFNEIPGGATALGVVDNLSHLQETIDGIWNGFLDNIKMQISGMFAVRGNVPALMKKTKFRFNPFEMIQMPRDAVIERIELGLNDFSPINVAQYMESLTEKRAGVNGYLLGGQSKVERVSNSVNLIHDQYKSKLTPIIDSVEIMMGRVAKNWVLLYLKYFSIEELEELSIKVDIGEKIKINDIDVEKIVKDEFINFRFNSLRNIQKEKQRQIILQSFLQIMQVKRLDNTQINEWMKALLSENFDPSKFLADISLSDKNQDINPNKNPGYTDQDMGEQNSFQNTQQDNEEYVPTNQDNTDDPEDFMGQLEALGMNG